MGINTNELVADMFAILDGNAEMTIPEIKKALINKGWKRETLNISRLFNDCLKSVYRKTNKTENKEITMKKETNETMTIETIIENLKSGKKEETLKKAKSEALSLGFTNINTIKTKKDMISYLETCSEFIPDTNNDTNNGTIVESVGTQFDKKQDDIIISMIAVRDGIATGIKALENNTLKSVKSSVYSLLNTQARVNLPSDFTIAITQANNIRTKKEYKSALITCLKELNTLIEQETDNQNRKEPKVVSIPEKAKALKPDTAMLISQLDIKEKSRFDTIFGLIKKQDKKIDDLTKMVQCHKDTINILIARLQDKPAVNDTGKKTEKTPEKTPEQIQAENRDKFIKAMSKDMKKVWQAFLSINRDINHSIPDILSLDCLEEMMPKTIKKNIVALHTVGLLHKDNKGKGLYGIAKVSNFKDTVKKDKSDTSTKKTPENKEKTPVKKGFKRGNKYTRKNAVSDYIDAVKSGDTFTRKDILLGHDDIYVKNGGTSASDPTKTCTNVVRNGIKKAIENSIIVQDGNSFTKA